MDFKTLKTDSVEVDGRTIFGYASTFGNKDLVNDIVEKGAFKKTLGERKPKVFYNHMFPIGSPVKIHEDSKGLFTESKISRTDRGDEILELVRDKVITEMSIAYDVVKYEIDEQEKVRYLKEIKLYEYGPVDFPANESAVIEGVKTLADRLRKGKKLDDCSLKDIQSALHTLQQLVQIASDPEPPNGTQGEPLVKSTLSAEPSVIDTKWISELGSLVHDIAEAAKY